MTELFILYAVGVIFCLGNFSAQAANDLMLSNADKYIFPIVGALMWPFGVLMVFFIEPLQSKFRGKP